MLKFQKIRGEALEGKMPNFQVFKGGVLRFHGRLCVPYDVDLKNRKLTKAHCSNYIVHPRSMKMYQNLRQHISEMI